MLDEVIDKVDVVRVVYQDEYIHVGSFFCGGQGYENGV